MAIQVSYPGVYIEEFAPGAPIQGASISTPAFIGVATDGPIDQPTRLTSWDGFRHTYGEHPIAGFYLWYAVKGFFDNGGQSCYVVRASNGAYGEEDILTTTGGLPLFTVRARQPGSLAIQLAIAKTNVMKKANTSLFLLSAALTAVTVAGDTSVLVSLADGALIRPGDRVTIALGGEQVTVLRVIFGIADATVMLSQPLTGTYAIADKMRFVDTLPGETTFRLVSTVPVPPGTLAPGAMLTFEQAPTPAKTQVVQSVQTEVLSAAKTTYRVTLREGLGFAVDMTKATTVQSNEFDFTVKTGAGTKTYASLVLDPAHPKSYVDAVNGDAGSAVTILPATPTPAVAMPGILPANQALSAMPVGADQDVATLANADFTRSIDTLHQVSDASILACPDNRTLTVQRALIDQCELLADRFAVIDCNPQLDPFDTAAGVPFQRAGVSSMRGYAAYYYPWLSVPPEGAGPPVLVPPSGHVCGVYARVDATRGVFKAPANEYLNGALGVERALTDIEHGLLNLSGVDVTRVFQGGGRPIVFGARTTATDTNWQYVNIRRLFLFLEKSIQQGIQWAVFEPNNLQLWQKLKRSIGDFLDKQWRDGALFGAKAEDAYYVRIDEALNPFSEQQLGRLYIEIGVRPSYPAEFIVVRIGIWPGGSAITEG